MKKTILLGLLLVFALTGCNGNQGGLTAQDILTPDEAKAEAEKYINESLIPPDSGQKATVANVTEENNLYKLDVELAGQNVSSYMTKDGKKFFPQGNDMEKIEGENSGNNGGDQAAENNQAQNQQPAATVSNKSETPQVELFVMSHCPYGTQMEKAILPVVKTLGEKIDFDLKFVDYAMHDKKEINEQLREYCIQKEEPEKLISYLDCFLESSDSESCQNEVGINTSALETCVSQTDEEFGIMEDYNDKSTWRGSFPSFAIHAEKNQEYGVSGSPTLVVNGQKVQAQRNPASLLETVCSAFSEKPSECEAELSSSSPSPGFGSSNSGGGSAGSCG